MFEIRYPTKFVIEPIFLIHFGYIAPLSSIFSKLT